MNVKDLRKAIEGLPDDMKVSAWTTGDSEFTVAIATIYERLPLIKAHLSLGNDPNEIGPNDKLLYADEVEPDEY